MLGVIAIVAIQRAIQKILIAVFLSREYKHDETNRAWWSGKWYGRGLGSSAFSQPAREYIVKIVEMSLWSSDFLLAHILLILAAIPLFIPFVDRLHSTMLCEHDEVFSRMRLTSFVVWLRPSKQIRRPVYSTKQKRQRRWMVNDTLLCFTFEADGSTSGPQVHDHLRLSGGVAGILNRSS